MKKSADIKYIPIPTIVLNWSCILLTESELPILHTINSELLFTITIV